MFHKSITLQRFTWLMEIQYWLLFKNGLCLPTPRFLFTSYSATSLSFRAKTAAVGSSACVLSENTFLLWLKTSKLHHRPSRIIFTHAFVTPSDLFHITQCLYKILIGAGLIQLFDWQLIIIRSLLTLPQLHWASLLYLGFIVPICPISNWTEGVTLTNPEYLFSIMQRFLVYLRWVIE